MADEKRQMLERNRLRGKFMVEFDFFLIFHNNIYKLCRVIMHIQSIKKGKIAIQIDETTQMID